MSTKRYNPSSFLSIAEVDSLVDRALAKDGTLPREAYAWMGGFGETRYSSECDPERIRSYVLSRWPEFLSRGKMAAGRRTGNIIEKLRANAGSLSNRYTAQGTLKSSEQMVWAIAVGYETIAFVHGGNAEAAITEAEVTWRWMYPTQQFASFLVGLGGKREADTRNGQLMLGMTQKVETLQEQAAATLKKAERLQDLLNTWAVLHPEQLQAGLAAG